jgi:zinc transporter 1/2/3
MGFANHLTQLVVRQATSDDGSDTCATGNDYDGRLGLRIAAIFIIWFGSTVGAVFPVFAKKNPYLRIPEWAFFIAKYFGSGVIVATAFIHLLGPAEDALRNPCLTGPITDYGWAEGIILMTIFVLFFIELMVMRYGEFGSGHEHGHSHNHDDNHDLTELSSPHKGEIDDASERIAHQPGEDHLGHARHHNDIEDVENPFSFEDYKAQLTAIFILEFGVIFHSVFIGLTLAVSGSEFTTLLIVLIFHQSFEGLGLGSRIAVTPWPKGKRWTPYILGFAYGLSTPIAIAIGLGVRKSYPPEGRTTLIVNGVFDSISAGILIYTGLVELMAHEFMFSNSMRTANIKVVLSAFLMMCMGAALMALLGKWA